MRQRTKKPQLKCGTRRECGAKPRFVSRLPARRKCPEGERLHEQNSAKGKNGKGMLEVVYDGEEELTSRSPPGKEKPGHKQGRIALQAVRARGKCHEA